MIAYDMRKDLPCDQLSRLFCDVGWSDGKETPEMRQNFNAPFLHSTVVVSAWDGDRLVGCCRALSDTMFRSVIYDVAVEPAYQGRGIGTALVRQCMAHYPGSQWLVATREAAGFYEKLGFVQDEDVFLSVPCKWF